MRYLILLLFVASLSANEIGKNDVDRILRVYDLEELNVNFSFAAINMQNKSPINQIDFLTAFKMALESFLYDEGGGQTPLEIFTILNGKHGQEVLKQHMLSSSTLISFPGIMPEGGESQKNNWIFSLQIESLGDYMFWAIVDRRGSYPVYNYGFN